MNTAFPTELVFNHPIMKSAAQTILHDILALHNITEYLKRMSENLIVRNTI